jgi:hypothetical protein
MQAILQGRTGTFDTDAVLREARRLFAERPRTFNELRADLIALFPDADERAMGYFVRTQIPLVTIPAEHDWSYRADACFGLAEDWLGEPLPRAARPHDLVLRYLAAFGPASAADVGAWSALRGLTPVLEDLRPQLRIFRDERKRELFDLPDGPRPLEDTPAPARFVADFDNLVLSHADRSRVIADEHRKAVVTKNGLVLPTILVDGFVAGTWKVTRTRKTVTLTVTPFSALPTRAREELAAESGDLLRFLEPDAPTTDLVFEAR